MSQRLLNLIPLLLITGCATDDYARYADSQTAIHAAKANAEGERFKAMALIAQSGDTTAKVAAMMAMQASRSTDAPIQIAAPKSPMDSLKEWVGMLLPAAVQGYGMYSQSEVAKINSANSAMVSQSTNAAFVGMAGKIQGNTDNHSQVLSGVGALGGGYSVTPAPVVVPTVVAPVVPIVPTVIQPTVIQPVVVAP